MILLSNSGTCQVKASYLLTWYLLRLIFYWALLHYWNVRVRFTFFLIEILLMSAMTISKIRNEKIILMTYKLYYKVYECLWACVFLCVRSCMVVFAYVCVFGVFVLLINCSHRQLILSLDLFLDFIVVMLQWPFLVLYLFRTSWRMTYVQFILL